MSSGIKNAYDYAYGVNPNVSPLVVQTGANAGAGVSLVIAGGTVALQDGTVISPLSFVQPTPITVGVGTNAETVTPTAVSYGNGVVTVTATFANAHYAGDLVTSGSLGIAEASNSAHQFGGLVTVDGRVALVAGGRAAALTLIGTIKGWTNVTVLDWMGTTGALSYKPTGAANGGLYVTSTVVIY